MSWLPRTQAAAYLGVHPVTLDTYARKGLIPYGKLPSGERRYREDWLDAVLAPAGGKVVELRRPATKGA